MGLVITFSSPCPSWSISNEVLAFGAGSRSRCPHEGGVLWQHDDLLTPASSPQVFWWSKAISFSRVLNLGCLDGAIRGEVESWKKFLDSSKLKRHFLIHTGERDFVCPHEGCGKAFSLDFNLRSHMKTHSQENYHICPYPECGKRYAHEYKLKNHIASHHEKNVDMTKYAQPPEKLPKTSTKPSAASAYGSASSDRPYCCPYEGCEKAYIHEYKLNLHLRREHPGHLSDENVKNTQSGIDNDMDEGSDQDVYPGKRGNSKIQKQSKPKPNLRLPPSKVARKGSTMSPANLKAVKKPWPVKEERYEDEDEDDEVEDDDEEQDSEETEEDRDNVEDGWRYVENNEDDDEETEYED
ncbi:hypothetical protein U1Q18_035477 [Sarracenia purpurea var. burkii]